MHVCVPSLRPACRLLAPLLLCLSCSQGQLQLSVLDRVLPPPGYSHVTIKIPDYCPLDGQTAKSFFALNASTKLKGGLVLEDLDRDGVPNAFEGNPLTGTSYLRPDTNSDGYGDLLMVVLGIPVASQVSLTACAHPELDTDNDGLNDCEEALLGTDPHTPDSDGDGISDYLELRYGLNPLDGSDAYQDPDGDGLSNLEEVRRNTPWNEFNDATVKGFEVAYDIRPVTIEAKKCYQLTVSNITLANVPNGNLERFFFLEANGLGVSYLRQGSVLIPVGTADGSVLVRPFADLTH